jgi:hypothetical protein
VTEESAPGVHGNDSNQSAARGASR